MLKCEFCDKQYQSKLSLGCHRIRCRQNPNRKVWSSWRQSSCWNKGLTKDTDQRLKKISEDTLRKIAKGDLKIKGHPHSKETKQKLSKIRSSYIASQKNSGGFRDIKWYEVENVKHEKFVVRGLWQYNVAIKLNQLNILWIRNKYLKYFIEDTEKTYNPDFYFPDTGEYLEVKGYFSAQDKVKMDAVIDQNPAIKIRFMRESVYKKFLSSTILLSDVPFYVFGAFTSGYKRKGVRKLNTGIKYCKVCGKELVKDQKIFCSYDCSNIDRRRVNLSDTEKVQLLKTHSIQKIADMLKISYNAVKKWKNRLKPLLE